MEYIAPNSDVYLLKGVPLDGDYQHTIFFDGATVAAKKQAQENYFLGSAFSPYHLTQQTYQRYDKGVIRVALLADTLLNYNYMTFRNTNFGGKWFFAFIDSVEYVNNTTTEVRYTIDVMQTWAFDYELGECFIERQHARSDIAGDNVIDENLETGEPQIVSREKISLGKQHAAVLSSTTPNGDKNVGEIRDGVYSGLYFKSGFALTDFAVSFLPVIYQFSEHTLEENPPKFTNFSSEMFTQTRDAATQTVTLTSTAALSENTTQFIAKSEQYQGLYGWSIQCKYNNNFINLDAVMVNSGWYNLGRAVKISATKWWVRGDSGIGEKQSEFSIIVPNAPTGSNLPTTAEQLKNYINSFNDPTAIVNIYQYPAILDESSNNQIGTATVSRPSTIYAGTSRSFTPKNKKLLSYPFLYVTAISSDGDNADYRFEDSGVSGALVLRAYATKNGTPTAILAPVSYRNHNGTVYEEAIVFSDFPNCSWTGDIYKTWFNQNKNSFILSSITGAISSGISGGVKGASLGGAAGAVAGAVIGTAASVGGSIAKVNDMNAVPPQAKGQIQCGTLRLAIDETGFYYMVMSLRPEYLQIIDNYFTMFGYAQKTLAVPDCHARRRFTFVKTKATVIHAASGTGLPADAEKKIVEIFEKGITFWAKTSTVTPDIGNYHDNNEPLGG